MPNYTSGKFFHLKPSEFEAPDLAEIFALFTPEEREELFSFEQALAAARRAMAQRRDGQAQEVSK